MGSANGGEGSDIGADGGAGSARYVQPATLHRTGNSYSHVVEVLTGRSVYVAGQVALDPSGALVGPGDIRMQTRQAFRNLGEALSAVAPSAPGSPIW